MRQLTILYDADCGFCRRCRAWLEGQPKYLAMRFVAQNSPEANSRWPDLATQANPEELLVISDDGGVYRAERAWIMVLYALRRYRSLAMRLAQPGLRPLARTAVHFVARYRHDISRLISDDRLLSWVDSEIPPPTCAPNVTDTMCRLSNAKARAGS